jgi:hypothetical protein
MSAEPVSWDLTSQIGADHPLDWIVIGAASSGKKYFQPHHDHVRNLLDVLDATATPVFYKGNIGPLFSGKGWEHSMTMIGHGTNANIKRERLSRWREDFPQTYRDGAPIPAVVRRQQMCEAHGWTKIALITVPA